MCRGQRGPVGSGEAWLPAGAAAPALAAVERLPAGELATEYPPGPDGEPAFDELNGLVTLPSK